MKQKNVMRIMLSVLLVLSMVLGIVGCGAKPATVSDAPNAPELSVQQPDSSEQPSKQEELTREEKEQVVDLLSDGTIDPGKLSDKELDRVVQDLTAELEDPTPEVEFNSGAYDENGAMKEPFDQVYPELVEKGEVEYDDESLLVKLASDRVTDGLKSAGVAALECIVPMEEYSWYEAKLISGTDAQKALAQLRELKEVKLAEYNYQIKTAAIDQYQEFEEHLDLGKNQNHNKQWHMHHFGIPEGYKDLANPGGNPSVVVAVIDTGVDYDHEDLFQNIWVNANEIPDNGIDDDQNGYVDDYYGVNIVDGKGSGDDDNGHGTHVAGIIAAQDNKLGIVGIAYNVKVMPIKAAMSSGILQQSDIAKAVLYAYENGAEIINMSFGGSSCSIAVQDALATAYTRCVLVASAGNDGKANEPGEGKPVSLPNYPAALTYVLGVMSVDQTGRESVFTNYDRYPYNGIEYELYAPGENIISTIPGDRYGQLNGTSMAAPVVSAMAAILRSEFSDRELYPTKFIYGQLSSTSDHYANCCDPEEHGEHNLPKLVNLHMALTKTPVPEVNLHDYAMFDTVGFEQDANGVNNGNGVVDAGETIAVGLTLRNHWGMSKNTLVTVDNLSVMGVPDPYVTVLNPTVDYGSVGTYSTRDCGKIYTGELLTGWENPFYIQISKDCPNDYIVSLRVTIQCENALAQEEKAPHKEEKIYTTTGTITLTVRNGVVLPAVIEEDMVLTADSLYIIPNSTVILEGVTVRVEPGTHIQFWSNDETDPYGDKYIAYLRVDGKFLVEGTKENPVYIYPSELRSNYIVELGEGENGFVSLRYADLTNYNKITTSTHCHVTGNLSVAYGCTFRKNSGPNLKYHYLENGKVSQNNTYFSLGVIEQAQNCVFYRLGHELAFNTFLNGTIKNCMFFECGLNLDYDAYLEDCVFLGNYYEFQAGKGNIDNLTLQIKAENFSVKPDSATVYYRPETGTTYVAYTSTTHTTGLWLQRYAQQLGGDYAAADNLQEWQWLWANLDQSAYYNLGISYDQGSRAFVWADGTKVPADWLPENTDTYTGQELKAYQGKLINHSTFSKYLYEIPGQIYLTDMTLPEYELQLDMDSTHQLFVSSEPANVEPELLIYESRDESVVTVTKSGVICPVGIGTADVYIYSGDRALYTYVTVEVRECQPLESLALSAPSQELAIGEVMNLTTVLTPVDTTRRNVTYTTSDASIATVDHYGRVTGIGSGTVTITATSAELDPEGNPIAASVTLTVYQKATELSLSHSTLVVAMNSETVELPQIITDAGAETTLSWSVSDPAVAQIRDGKLILKNQGSAALTVTDLRSGLNTGCLLLVQETAPSPVKKIEVDDTEHYVLLENGSLYHWCDDIHLQPILVLDDVQMFSAYYGMVTVLRDSGNLELWEVQSAEPRYSETFDLTAIGDRKIAGFEHVHANSCPTFVWTEDGYVYAWGGANANGSLGLGTTAAVTTPTLVMLENVVDVKCYSDDTTYFLTANGDLYIAGNGYSAPYHVEQNVAELLDVVFDSAKVLWKNGGIGTCGTDHHVVKTYVGSYEDVAIGLNAWIGIRDGVAYTSDFSSIVRKPIPGISNAKLVYIYSDATYGDTYYIVTEDGLLYGYGINNASKNHMAGMTNANPVTEPVLLPMGAPAEEAASVIDSNLQELNVLNEEKLELTFNKAIIKAAPKLYANGGQIVCGATIQALNCMTVTKSGGFLEGTVYELVFEAGSISAAAGVTNPEEIRITFTVQENTENENGSVIHKAVLDETVERFYWTAESYAAAMLECHEQVQYNPYFNGNVILNHVSTKQNMKYWLRPTAPAATSYTELPLGGNYWGSTDKTTIELQMLDFTDYASNARLMYEPYLTEAPENVFPFVTGITILNKEGEKVTTVGNEQITVRVSFNRDMDTTVPLLVRFGSAYPYGDYEIPGAYVDDRTWEGTYTIKTTIENGNQCFTISDGRTADGELDLCADRGRFCFAIDTTAAQALIMQGTAEDTGISLRWTQDDFDTLMGYHVYRSNAEDGLYTRLNATVIPADQMSFFDETVEPGQIYYYNFTVVKTDLTESEPSGKIVIMSKDTMAPNIYHSGVANAFTGSNLVVTATVTDNLSIIYAELYYRMVGETEWKIIRMNDLNDKYSAIIPAQHVTTAGIEYYIDAFDGVSHTYKGTADSPYTIVVQEAVDVNSLGDVDGDGIITNLDALLLLYAINDKYNLTAEEFARADLNGDGELWAAEALRILQYVSGVVGSVKM